MRHKLLLFFLAANVIWCVPAMTQTTADYGNVLGLGVEIGFPTGDFSDFADIGLGVYGNFQFPWTDQIDLMANIGYLAGGGANEEPGTDYSWSMIPAQFGGKYYLDADRVGLYFGALAGVHYTSIKVDIPNVVEDSDSDLDFAIAPLAGYEFLIGETTTIDVGGRYQFVGSDRSYFAIRGGINFLLR